MISLTSSTAVPFASQARRPVPAAEKLVQPLKAQSVSLPSLTDMRDQQKSRMKEFAARKVQAVRERMDALKLMVKLDPKAALKMTAELAKELRSAVKAYVEAGGKNPSSGEMKMAIQAATEARDAADTAASQTPPKPTADDAGSPGPAAPVDAETKRAQAAYTTAVGVAEDKGRIADRLEAVVQNAFGDMGFFDQVRLAVAEIKEAREKIRGDWANPRAPSKDDWKAADKELAGLEREIDLAPTGVPGPSSAAPATMMA